MSYQKTTNLGKQTLSDSEKCWSFEILLVPRPFFPHNFHTLFQMILMNFKPRQGPPSLHWAALITLQKLPCTDTLKEKNQNFLYNVQRIFWCNHIKFHAEARDQWMEETMNWSRTEIESQAVNRCERIKRIKKWTEHKLLLKNWNYQKRTLWIRKPSGIF